MTQPRRGRSPRPLDPDASHAARLGAAIRARRQAQRLTLKALAELIGFSPQHLSEVERANVSMSELFVEACDRALDAHGTLEALLPAVVCERALQRHDRSTARRRSTGQTPTDAQSQAPAPALEPERYAEPQHPSEAGEDVDPLSRRSLFGAGVGAVAGLNATTAPVVAREIDPEIVSHWMKLLQVLEHHGGMYGPHSIRDTVRRELDLIAEHRLVARGDLRTDLMRTESRWAELACWLSNDVGDWHRRDAWANHSLRLARESDYPDMVALVLLRRCQWAVEQLDARNAIMLADAACSIVGTNNPIRKLCALKRAHAHALNGDQDASERSLTDVHARLDTDSMRAPWDDLVSQEVSAPYVLASEARCAAFAPSTKAISKFEDVLRRWPPTRTRDQGMLQARLALACAGANEPERAVAEGIKALGITQSTKSDVTMQELKRLDRQLAGCDVPAAADFREAFAAL